MFEDVGEEWWERGVACDFCGHKGPHKVLVENARGNHHNLVECVCGLRFFDPRVSAQWMKRSLVDQRASSKEAINCRDYGTLTGPSDTFTPEQMKQHLAVFAHAVFMRCVPLCGVIQPKVYEVGACIGWLLKGCLDAGAHPESGGCEAGPGACEIGAQALGVSLDAGLFQDVTPPHAPYDIVITNDMIEHTYTPHADLRKMRRIARQGAVLFLKTFIDDLDVPLGRPMMLPPWHSFHFTRVTLRRALESAGWNINVWEEDAVWAQPTVIATAM